MTAAAGISVQEQPGWTALAAGRLHVLVRWDAGSPALHRLHEAAASGDLDEILDVLAREGLRQAPDFVAVQEGSPTRVVARGTAYAVASGPTGPTELRAAGRGPWSDQDVPLGATGVELRTGEDPEPATGSASAAATPSGWRLPSRLGRRGGEPQAASAEPAPPASDEVDELPSYDHLFGATQRGRPEPAAPQFIEAHDTETISEPGIGQAPIEAAGGFTPAPQGADQTLPPPTDTGRARPRAAATEGVGPKPSDGPSAPQHHPAAPVAPPVPGGLIDSVPWRGGGSNIAPPEPSAAPAPPEPSAGRGPATPPPPAGPAGVRTPSPAPALRPMPLPPAPTSPATPTPRPVAATSVPAPPAPTSTAPAPLMVSALPVLDPGSADDDPEATVDRRALLAAAQAESGPLVLAVLCPAGHPSPPHAGTCRSCGRDIPAQQPFQTPRPPLGMLRLASGDVVSLDRGVLLGRAPKVNADLPAAERPHLVRVPSPENDISRNHVEVVLEGWHVLVRDLASTNGTTVALPGQVAVRLRPGDQQVLEPGTVITLADEVSVTFEVGA